MTHAGPAQFCCYLAVPYYDPMGSCSVLRDHFCGVALSCCYLAIHAISGRVVTNDGRFELLGSKEKPQPPLFWLFLFIESDCCIRFIL